MTAGQKHLINDFGHHEARGLIGLEYRFMIRSLQRGMLDFPYPKIVGRRINAPPRALDQG